MCQLFDVSRGLCQTQKSLSQKKSLCRYHLVTVGFYFFVFLTFTFFVFLEFMWGHSVIFVLF